MCGIAGILSKGKNITQVQIEEMCTRMTLRGPDAQGIYLNKNVALGHRRLSIIDLDTGDQPMYSTNKNVIIVFNGEIYNFNILKNDLIQKGYIFNTTSDTEVIINSYLEYGIEKCLENLEGMFAFALYDVKKETLYVARDKFGEKPLYYISKSDAFLFASELKALMPELQSNEICKTGLNYFLSLTYIPAPFTIYKNIHKLMPGSFVQVEQNKEIVYKTYFKLQDILKNVNPIMDIQKAKELIYKKTLASVKSRMISDVPIGAFLSGGIDSSIISALMSKASNQPINTFTIGFNEKAYDESKRAKLVADEIKSNHTVHFLDYKDVVNIIDEIILYYDEPFGDSSALPSYYVAKLAREKVKVVLTGDCADELFGGYEKYLASYYSSKYNKLPNLIKSIVKWSVNKCPHNRFTNSKLRKIKKVINNSNLSPFELHYSLMCLGFNDNEKNELLQNNWFESVKPEIEEVYNSCPLNHPLEKSQYTDIRFVLEGDMFVKTDRVCMKNSLESRAPFIDTEIVKAAFSIPPDFKIKGKIKKRILKETFKDILPKGTIKFGKKGFGVPIDYWFKNELKPELLDLFKPDFIEKQGIFNKEYIKRLLNEHFSGKENHKGKLWNLFVFQKWYIKNKTIE